MTSGWILVSVKGVVQGVGFRPAVYRVARRMGLAGTVENAVDGVHIMLRATPATASLLIDGVRGELPGAARIDSVECRPCSTPSPLPESFTIVMSDDSEGRVTDVSPDIAICPECLDEVRSNPRRKDYPLTNCTNCGPRFTIITALPYDRPHTSMRKFDMCDECRMEYTDPLDRRFHAQPIACNHCGPRYSLADYSIGEDALQSHLPTANLTDYPAILDRCVHAINLGEIIMVKSLGGYNLMADATSSETVRYLRDIKHRPRKPFAVMVADEDAARNLIQLSPKEHEALVSWRAPIVVGRRADRGTSNIESGIAPEVAPGCVTLGVMLPYMAFQHHITRRVGRPLVVTSANLPGSPIMTDDAQAQDYARLHHLTVVSFDRDIVNRVDDSVVRLCGGDMRILRHSRGYVPEPLPCSFSCDSIVAMGADVTSAWAMGRDSDIIQSQYIGSLTEEGGERCLRESISTMLELFRCKPRLIVTDTHPGYRSSAIGREIASRLGVPCIGVWHHHAHAAGVMAEYGYTDGSPVLALVLDGTGYGTDGTIWGAELLKCTLSDFTRLDHGPALPLPGGDAAAREPWRMAVSLAVTYGYGLEALPSHIVESVGTDRVAILARMIERGINSPISYGAGRMWDALAALLGVALFNGYEAEAPVLLENLALTSSRISSEVSYHHHLSPVISDGYPTDFPSLVALLMKAVAEGISPADIALDFHHGYASCWQAKVASVLSSSSPRTIVLSGGVMQNALIATLLRQRLEELGLTVLLPRSVPCSDAGVAVGQIAVGARMMKYS